MTRSGGRRAAVALLLAAALAAPSASSTAAGCAGVRTTGNWTAIDLPAGAAPDTAVVVPGRGAARRDVLLVAAGRSILRSADGGCTWATAVTVDIGATSPWKTDPELAFWGVSAGPAGRTGAHAVYAVAGDSYNALAVATPVVTYTSLDDGAHWTAHDPAAGDLAGDVPRCSRSAAPVVAGPVPGTAYLYCIAGTLGELFLSLGPPVCHAALYVTTDSGTTWRPVAGRYSDPAAVSVDDPSGCPAVSHGDWLAVDPTAPHALVQAQRCEKAVYRSTDDGRTLTVYATLPRTPEFCVSFLSVAVPPRAGRVVLTCDNRGLLLATKPGTVEAPVLHVKTSESGTFRGCAFLPGTTTVLGFVFDIHHNCRVYRYDLLRKAFTPAGLAPVGKDGCPWNATAQVLPVPAPGSRAVYFRSSSDPGRLYRVAS